MEALRSYLNSLSTDDQAAFAESCETSIGYLRKAISAGDRIREKLCIAIERESGGKVRCEDLRPDVDWAYLRGSTADPDPSPIPRLASQQESKPTEREANPTSSDAPGAASRNAATATRASLSAASVAGVPRTGADPACMQGAA